VAYLEDMLSKETDPESIRVLQRELNEAYSLLSEASE
jgi:hypothetical protein